jgi:hypothetical protein
MARLIIRQNILPRAASWSRNGERGGHVACVLQWLLGFKRLGHDVLFVNTISGVEAEEQKRAVQSFIRTVEPYWDLNRSILLDLSDHRALAGITYADLKSFTSRCNGLITVATTCEFEPPPPLDLVRPRIFIDHDPGYTQLWAEIQGATSIIGQHDFHFTIGGNVGTGRSTLPTCGIEWYHTWNPIVIEWWPVANAIIRNRFTTVADWWGYKYLEFEGKILGPKREEFLKFLSVPQLSGEELEIALDIGDNDEDRNLLGRHGWQVTSPAQVESVDGYRGWIVGSVGEFSCAKGVYVGTRSGWFSDRSAAYLAAGRPAIIQETGFSDLMPTGEGLLSFRTVEEAVESICRVRHDYEHHSAAARKLAATFFDSKRILPDLLRKVGL